jgi:hypothetical protein
MAGAGSRIYFGLKTLIQKYWAIIPQGIMAQFVSIKYLKISMQC